MSDIEELLEKVDKKRSDVTELDNEVTQIVSRPETENRALVDTLDRARETTLLDDDVYHRLRTKIEQADSASDQTRINHPASDALTILSDDHTRLKQPQDEATVLAQDAGHATQADAATIMSDDKTRIKPSTVAVDAAVATTKREIVKNRFILEELIGAGGMGTVYKARDLRKEEAEDRNPFVALKVLNEEFKHHPDAFKSLQRETQKTQKLAHPNIITVFDFDRDDNVIYMTMELLQGKTLKQYIREHPTGQTLAEVADLVRGMSLALSYAHQNDIVHADFKPGNVFVTDDNKLKVMDFGIARAVPREDDANRDTFDAGSLGALTPTYASLEMIEGASPDPRDDIYALACIIYELLTGSHPYQRLPADKAREKKLQATPVKDLKKRQWQALNQALAFDREQRLPSVDALLEGLLPSHRTRNRLAVAVSLFVALSASAYSVFKEPETIEVPLSIVELTPEQANEIQTLLDTADLYIALGQLATPPGDSALDLYDRVLSIDSANKPAIDGKRMIADRYEELTRAALDAGDNTMAQSYLKTGLLAMPTHDGLKAIRSSMESVASE